MSTNDVRSDEGFVLQIEVGPSGDAVRSVMGIPRYLLPAQGVDFRTTPIWGSISKLLQTWRPRFIEGSEKDPERLPWVAIEVIEQTALQYWHLELWTKDGTAGRKSSLDTTIRVMTEEDAAAQSSSSKQLMKFRSVEFIVKERRAIEFVAKKAALITYSSVNTDQESFKGEYGSSYQRSTRCAICNKNGKINLSKGICGCTAQRPLPSQTLGAGRDRAFASTSSSATSRRRCKHT